MNAGSLSACSAKSDDFPVIAGSLFDYIFKRTLNHLFTKSGLQPFPLTVDLQPFHAFSYDVLYKSLLKGHDELKHTSADASCLVRYRAAVFDLVDPRINVSHLHPLSDLEIFRQYTAEHSGE